MLVFLYGPPGVGKSTVGRLLAARLGWPFLDLDRMIEARAGRPIPALFRTLGEAGFRDLEAAALQRAVAQGGARPGAVVALGGGALLRADSRRLVERQGPVVLLSATPDTLRQRLARQRGQRPLLPEAAPAALEQLLQKRAAHYASFPRKVSTDGVPLPQVAWQAQIQAGAFRLEMASASSEILVGTGLFARLGEELAARFPERPRVMLLTDAQVGAHHAAALEARLTQAGFEVHSLTLPVGEATKSLAWLERVWGFWLTQGADRRSLALALGGGVVGDLTGFAAGTFMRGIPWVNLPTSLLAMVDAAVGGKTGVNLAQGKNLVGLFYPPRLVLTDPRMLETLPAEEWRSGLAEVVKHALIADPLLWRWLQEGFAALRERSEALVRRALAVKVRIVAQDPLEAGLRELLNAGHTLGHAVEAASRFGLRHGEAVAIGLVLEAHLAARLGLAEPAWPATLAQTLEGLGLPVRLPTDLSGKDLVPFLRQDKKRRGDQIRWALPCGVGRVCRGRRVPPKVLDAVLRQASR